MNSNPNRIHVTYRHLYIRSVHLGKSKLYNYSFAPTRSISHLRTPSANTTPSMTRTPTPTGISTLTKFLHDVRSLLGPGESGLHLSTIPIHYWTPSATRTPSLSMTLGIKNHPARF